jgi:sterol desaturase/sphingolipid hydroxylase (fatty acid hydroxylase superfamily)
MRKRAETVRLFDNAFLEGLSRVHPLAPALLWTPIIALLIWRSIALHPLGPGVVGALAAGGLLAWSFAEYTIHRFVFHLAPRTPGRRRLQFLLHGVHHECPDDRTRLLMPPVPAAAAAILIYGGFRLVLGPACVDPFFASFLAGYLAYDYTHLYLHRGRPRTRLGRYLRRHHLSHHFATPNARWGVTSPLWDWIFRSMGEERAIPVAR